MNDNAAKYVIACIRHAPEMPTPDTIRRYLLVPIGDARSMAVINYAMLDHLAKAINENRAVDALNIFNLIWWDITKSNAQRIFRHVQDMECDPDDDLASYTAITLSHTILAKFPTLT